MSLLCKVFSHKYYEYAKPESEEGRGIRWLKCRRCSRSFVINDIVRTIVPMDFELKDMYKWQREENKITEKGIFDDIGLTPEEKREDFVWNYMTRSLVLWVLPMVLTQQCKQYKEEIDPLKLLKMFIANWKDIYMEESKKKFDEESNKLTNNFVQTLTGVDKGDFETSCMKSVEERIDKVINEITTIVEKALESLEKAEDT